MEFDIDEVAELSKKVGAKRLFVVSVDDDGYSYAAVGEPGEHELEAKAWANVNAEEIAERLLGIHEPT
jgi:hypothetical protein